MFELKFDTVFYYVTDLEKAISFYRDKLNLRLISQDVVARFDIDGVLFELVPTNDESKLSGQGNARLCLKVDNLDRTIEKLQSIRIKTSKVKEVENGKLASFNDPDGNELVLWQYQ